MKGIILAGGYGSRLYPVTLSTSKQLLPVYDKPMIFYPLTLLMMAGIKDILIICMSRDFEAYKTLFGDGSKLGIKISYEIQHTQNGVAASFLIGERFIGNQNVALVLGDNLLFGDSLMTNLKKSRKNHKGAKVYAYRVKNPEDYGVVEFNNTGKVISLVEKPKKPKSNYAIIGLYFYDNKVIEYAKKVKPSINSELQITDINKMYFKNGELFAEKLGRGYAWLDAGTIDGLYNASTFVKSIQERQGIQIGCPEEVSYRLGYLSKNEIIKNLPKSNQYSNYVRQVLNE